MALGGRRVGVVACYSWCFLVPRWLGDRVSVKRARRLYGAPEKALCGDIDLIPIGGRRRASLLESSLGWVSS